MKKLKEAKENEEKRQDREDSAKLKLIYIQMPSCLNPQTFTPSATNRLIFAKYSFRYYNRALEGVFKPPRPLA